MGYKPYFVEGHDPEAVHQQLAGVLDAVVAEIKQIWADAARTKRHGSRRPGLADDRLPHAEGLDLPGRRSTARSARTTGAATRCRWATWTSPSTSTSSNSG